MSVCGSQVCLCLGQAHPHDTLIWEWTTGKLIFVRSRIKPLRCADSDIRAGLQDCVPFPYGGRLLLAACNLSYSSTYSQAVLELYDTSPAGEPGKLQCEFTLPSRHKCRSSVEVYSGDSYHYIPSTLSTRPEDCILTIFVEETPEPLDVHPSDITLIVVFVSTLLRLSESCNVVTWEEWKKYAWVADHQEADELFHFGAFISSSRIIHFDVPKKQQGVMTLEVTPFRPSLVKRLLHVPDDTSDGSCDGGARLLIGKKASLDVYVEDDDDDDDDDDEVMMTEYYFDDGEISVS